MAIGEIGKYDRLNVLGHGTSGVVYLAWDRFLRRHVALKEIRAAAPEMDRVLEEARLLDRLRHPNIVAVHSVDRVEGAVLIDMELVRGRNLADVLKERQGAPLPVEEAIRIALAILDALGYAHEQRIVHRDVKPANILIGEDNRVKLTDFGLAEALGSASVAGGGGTYPYMAPEDFSASAASDYRADLWAVGVMLYEMLTGRRPFAVSNSKDPFAWKNVIENEDPPLPSRIRPNLPAHLDSVLARALAKPKNARFSNAREFADALQRAVPNTVATVRIAVADTPARVPVHGWFWPLLALCIAPPVEVLIRYTAHASAHFSLNAVLAAWAASGVLSAMLLIVAVGVDMAVIARVICFVPIALGLISAGVLAKSRFGIPTTPDEWVSLAGVLLLPLAVLMLQSVTITRLWRGWVFLIIVLALLASAQFIHLLPFSLLPAKLS